MQLFTVDSAKQSLRVSHVRSGCNCSYRFCGRFCGTASLPTSQEVHIISAFITALTSHFLLQHKNAPRQEELPVTPFLAQKAQGSFLLFSPHDDSCVSSRTLCTAGEPAQAPIHFPLVSSIHPATQTGQGRAVFSCSSCQPAQQCHSLCRGTV